MLDFIAIAALVISIGSFIFVAIKEGIGLTLEYRESEVTRNRKLRIDGSLRKELKEKTKSFWKKGIPVDTKDEEEAFEALQDLGRYSHHVRFATEDMLDSLSSHSKAAFKCLLSSMYFLFFTIVIGVYFGLADWVSWFYVLIFALPTIIFLGWTVRNFRKHYAMREEFVRLSENPTLKYCDELIEDLIEKNLM